ncbi:MAG: DUF58 domain-containing protein [Chloroflexia bacterium]
MPTFPGNANAYRLAFFTLVIYISALTVGSRLFFYLAYVLAAVLVSALIWSQVSRRGLAVRRIVQPSTAQVGQVIHESIEVRNLSWLRKLWIEVRDRSTLPGHQVGAVVTLPGNKAKRWNVRTRCLRRGLYRLGPTLIQTGDPFGLFQTSRLFDTKGELIVYPATAPLSSFGLPASDLPGGTRTQRRAYHSTPNAAGIREYQAGDPTNRIHWPISARTQKLMVKEFELDPTADLWLVLDLQEEVHVSASESSIYETAGTTGSRGESRLTDHGLPVRSTTLTETVAVPLDPTTEEYAVAVTASLASYFLEQGKSVGLIAWGQHKVTLPADRGGRQLVKMLRALAVLRAEGTVGLGELLTAESRQFSRQDTIVIVTPSLDESWVGALQVQLYKGITSVAVLVEPGTFGGEGNPMLLVSALSAIKVPSYLVKRDDSINSALGQEYGQFASRNLR